MKLDMITLPKLAPGLEPRLAVWRFGEKGAGPRVYIQGGLHADEAPGSLVAHRLIDKLRHLAPNKILGEITVVPVANPIGLGQRLLGTLVGRFAVEDGRNFNRGFPNCAADVISRLEGRTGDDSEKNTALLRAAFAESLAEKPREPVPAMKLSLLREAIGADFVLDLHCDTEAILHAYTQPTSLQLFLPLFQLLALEVVLLAESSGDDPFDEAISGTWQSVRSHFLPVPFSGGGHAATIELRGQADTGPEFIDQDAEAIFSFLVTLGAIDGETPRITGTIPKPTPLAGCALIPAPVSGALSWHQVLGSAVRRGDCIAKVIDIESGISHPVLAECSGVLFARTNQRQVNAGAKLGKIAGATAFRSGQLLGP